MECFAPLDPQQKISFTGRSARELLNPPFQDRPRYRDRSQHIFYSDPFTGVVTNETERVRNLFVFNYDSIGRTPGTDPNRFDVLSRWNHAHSVHDLVERFRGFVTCSA